MKVKQEIQLKYKEFLNLCRSHSVRSLYAYGSATNETFNDQTSDIDLLVEIDANDPVDRGEKLMALWDNLEVFFQRKIDLLTESSIKNPVLKRSIDRTKILIYDGASQKVLI